MRLLLVALVFAADLWALFGILDATMSRGQRLKWIALVVGVPIVGFLLWRRRRPRNRLGPLRG